MTRSFTTSPITRSLFAAAFIIAASAALSYASPAFISDELARRLLGAMLGAVVVLYANAAPKALTPLTRMRCDPVVEQALRRFAGRTLVLGGLGYTAASLLAPIESAQLLAIAALGSAVLAVVIRYGIAVGSDRRAR